MVNADKQYCKQRFAHVSGQQLQQHVHKKPCKPTSAGVLATAKASTHLLVHCCCLIKAPCLQQHPTQALPQRLVHPAAPTTHRPWQRQYFTACQTECCCLLAITAAFTGLPTCILAQPGVYHTKHGKTFMLHLVMACSPWRLHIA